MYIEAMVTTARGIKCDGARPLCRNCMRLSVVCIYDLDTKGLNESERERYAVTSVC